MILKTKKEIDIASLLLTARNQLHVFHLQTNSYAQHIALGAAYDSIGGMLDSFVETIQGKTLEILKGYSQGELRDYTSKEAIITYNKAIINQLEMYRNSLPTNWDNIDNQIQVIIDLFESTNYKLKFLN